MSLEQEVKEQGLELGFDAVGITGAEPISGEQIAHLEAWLRSGYAGRMDYMHRHLEKRVDPAKLLEGAQSVVVVALNYKTGDPDAAPARSGGPVGRIAQYAQFEDYHDFMKPLLRELAGFLHRRADGTHRFKVCVDSAPLAEKALAVRAGLGFIGKNHLLVHPKLGPGILLGEVLTTVRLRPDRPGAGSCGGCDRCVRSCPTGALRADGFLDARRCVSYLTQYERRDRLAQGIGDWLFGCDECLLACPYADAAPARANRRFRRYPDRAVVSLRELLAAPSETAVSRFHDSPMGASGIEMLRRNAQLCVQNLMDAGEKGRGADGQVVGG